MKFIFLTALTVLTAATPAFAEFRPRSAAAHMRPQLFHDRSPHIHNRGAQPRRGA